MKQDTKRRLYTALLWMAILCIVTIHATGLQPAVPNGKGNHSQSNTRSSAVKGPAQKPDSQSKKAQNTESNTPASGDQSRQIAVPGADYIPCKFTLAELRALQAPDLAPTLSPAEVEELQTKIVNAAAAQDSDPSVSGPALTGLISTLASKDFTTALRGLTPSQALNLVIEQVRKNRDHEVQQSDIDWYAHIVIDALDGVNFPAPPGTTIGSGESGTKNPSQTSNGSPSGSEQPSSSGISTGKQSTRDNITPLLQAIDKLHSEAQDKDQSQPTGTYDPKSKVEKDSTPKVTRGGLLAKVEQLVVASQLTSPEKIAVLLALNKSKALDQQGLIDAARLYLSQLERPPDVGCSMSLLSWREVEYAFGYLIANEYIAVQVVVRNLNDKQEFVLHDVEFEVDADPTGRLGRFYSGRDKVVVRALASSQSTGDPRNLTMNIASGIGGVMSAAQTVFGNPLADAAGVFNSAFLPAFNKGWKDLSGEQLKMIDDNTFSSTASSQQSVPKSGTVVFYTFIPAKQFQEGWWTQPCVEKIYLGTVDSNGRHDGLSRGNYAQQNLPGAPANNLPPAGIDVQRALEVCSLIPEATDKNGNLKANPLPRHHSLWSTMLHRGPLLETKPDDTVLQLSPGIDAASQTQTQSASSDSIGSSTSASATIPDASLKDDLFRNAYSIPYRRWSPNSMAIFRELANTVVAGVHTITEDQLQPSITQLKCPVDEKGVIDWEKVDKNEVSCTLTGRNLDKYSKLVLRNAADAVDPTTLDAAVTVTGDNTNATVNWPAAALHSLNGANYLVYSIGVNGAEQKTNQAIHLDTGPFVTKVENTSGSNASFDLKSTSAQVLKLTGFHLANVQKVELKPTGDAAEGAKRANVTLPLSKNAKQSDTEASFDFASDSLAKLGLGTAALTLDSVDASGKSSTKDAPDSISINVIDSPAKAGQDTSTASQTTGAKGNQKMAAKPKRGKK